MKTTTREQAVKALEIVKKGYAKRGYRDEIMGGVLLSILTANDEPYPGYNATEFRNLLWNNFTGGGHSANVTREVFAFLGREDETDPNWC